jgi:chromosome segregation ATPase
MSLAENLHDSPNFIPIRRTRQQPVPQMVQPEETLSRNAARVAEGIEKLQESERKALADNAELKARLEQFQIKHNEQASELASLELELTAERNERIRLSSVIEQTIHGLTRAAEQPGQNEQD